MIKLTREQVEQIVKEAQDMGKNPDLSGMNLIHVDLSEMDLFRADFSGANLISANLKGADLRMAKLNEATLNRANFSEANLIGASLKRAKLKGTNLNETNLSGADFSEADLWSADLSRANLREANFSGANLSKANLMSATLDTTNFTKANLTGCFIYGIAAWNLNLEGAEQRNLVISPPVSNDPFFSPHRNSPTSPISEPLITVDSIEVAQFINLLLNNKKIRGIIDTIGKKAVLILGRFFPQERKVVLDDLRERLRELNYMPIVFDFDRPDERDFTETIMTLAGMCLFIIADITNPKSSPLESQAIVPNYMIPFVPIIQEGEKPFAMFKDLHAKYDWVLAPLEYDTASNLVAKLEKAIIEPALEKHRELMIRKAKELRVRSLKNY